MTANWWRGVLICPDCGAKFISGQQCSCGFSAPSVPQLDLRPSRNLRRTLEFELDGSLGSRLQSIETSRPRNDYRGPVAIRDSSELFSAIHRDLRPGMSLLDLGCGPRDQKPVADFLKLDYLGIDFSSAEADVRADAHSIPVADGSFDIVFAYAVFEHLYNPFVAATEVRRVLKPGGIFLGAVSQGEPFHDSFFHHTPLGVISLLAGSQFTLERVWPSYDALHSLAVMGRYSRVTRLLIEGLYQFDRLTPFLAPRAWLRSSPKQKELEALYRAASLCFVARV